MDSNHSSGDNLHYRYLADAMPTIVWTARPDGYVDYYNRRWYEYTGLTWEESDRYGASPIMEKEEYARLIRTWNRAIATEKIYEIEYRLRRASDGMIRWHLGRA